MSVTIGLCSVYLHNISTTATAGYIRCHGSVHSQCREGLLNCQKIIAQANPTKEGSLISPHTVSLYTTNVAADSSPFENSKKVSDNLIC